MTDATTVLVLLAATFDAHARSAVEHRCTCDVCCWITTAPGVLDAIASVSLVTPQCLGVLALGTTRYRCQAKIAEGGHAGPHTFAVSALDMRVQWRAPSRGELSTLHQEVPHGS